MIVSYIVPIQMMLSTGDAGVCSTCTGQKDKPRLTVQYVDASTMRITEFGYDWQGRLIYAFHEQDADGNITYEKQTYDNLNRTVKSERFLLTVNSGSAQPTGKGRWLSNFQKLVDDDWTHYNGVGDLVGGAVYGGDGHSVRIDALILVVTQTITRYRVETSEKYRDSGVYKREISAADVPSENVKLGLKGALDYLFNPLTNQVTSVNMDERFVNKFYTP